MNRPASSRLEPRTNRRLAAEAWLFSLASPAGTVPATTAST